MFGKEGLLRILYLKGRIKKYNRCSLKWSFDSDVLFVAKDVAQKLCGLDLPLWCLCVYSAVRKKTFVSLSFSGCPFTVGKKLNVHNERQSSATSGFHPDAVLMLSDSSCLIKVQQVQVTDTAYFVWSISGIRAVYPNPTAVNDYVKACLTRLLEV